MSAPLPSLNWLRVFEAAARNESFARAALELGMSAAAVSQQIKALEERVGAPLFTRHAHAVRLTDLGRAYLPSVQQALLTVQNATEGLFGPARAPQLFVQAVLIFAHGVLARHHAAFQQAMPGVALSLTTPNDITEFGRGYTDLKIVFGTPLAYGAEGDFLLGERLFPVATPALAAQIAAPQDLLGFPLLEVSTHRAGWAYLFEALGVVPSGARFTPVDSTVMAMAFAEAGAGIALARAPVSDAAMRASGLVPCLPDVAIAGREGYHLVYPDREALRSPAKRYRDWLIALCEGL